MTKQKNHTQQGRVTSSFLKGVRFAFEDQGQHIVAMSSFFTPKKYITVNGEEISKKYSLAGTSPHQFRVNHNQYEIEIKLESTLLLRMSCTLIKDGTHVETLYFSYSKNRKAYLKMFIGFFIIGAISGFIGSKIVLGW